MMNLKILATICLATLTLPGATGSIYTIADDRIKKLDINPVLGRGYSIMTNSFTSTCLMVDESTVPSYNYKYTIASITELSESNEDSQSQTQRTDLNIGISLGFFSVKYSQTQNTRNTESESTSKTESESRLIISAMSIERFYSSVREEVSPLSQDAVTLLDGQDYVGFFKSCGPNYVRSIRRIQEVAAFLKFKTASKESASSYMDAFSSRKTTWKVGVGGYGKKRSRKSRNKTDDSKFKGVNSSLIITITGVGLGLNQEGSETMVATTLDEHDEVMKFAFRTMTQNSDYYHIGLVFGIEVAPWVNNAAFQVAAKLSDEVIEIPMPRSLMPKAYKRNGDSAIWNNAQRDTFRCKDETFLPDKFGYCCELEQMFNYLTNEYTGVNADASTHVCKPVRPLDPNIIKDNMSNNAEFVSRLDGAMRYKLSALSTLERCISAAHALPNAYRYNILNQQANVNFANSITVTLAELKMAIDPKGDYGVIKHMAKELDEWTEMFYAPCYAALFGANIGSAPDVDVAYFVAYPWYAHRECMYLSCLTNNQRWNRNSGGCEASMITGSNNPYIRGEDAYCAKTVDKYDREHCKISQDDLVTVQTSSTSCGRNLPGTVDSLINYYCLPQVSTTTVHWSLRSSIDRKTDDCKNS